MPKIKLNNLDYGGSPTVEDADHLMVADTRNQTLSAQNIITNILGDMAQLEHNATASKPYVKGEYLVLGSYFYKTTDDIAQGDTLVAGTNIEQTNIGAEMSELNSNQVSGSVILTSDASGYIWLSGNIPGIQNAKNVLVNDSSMATSGGGVNYRCVLPWKQRDTGNWITRILDGNSQAVGNIQVELFYRYFL